MLGVGQAYSVLKCALYVDVRQDFISRLALNVVPKRGVCRPGVMHPSSVCFVNIHVFL
jgi:hypothetical protein